MSGKRSLKHQSRLDSGGAKEPRKAAAYHAHEPGVPISIPGGSRETVMRAEDSEQEIVAGRSKAGAETHQPGRHGPGKVIPSIDPGLHELTDQFHCLRPEEITGTNLAWRARLGTRQGRQE